MKVLDLLIEILRDLLYEAIDKYGLIHKGTIKLNQRLYRLIVCKSKNIII